MRSLTPKAHPSEKPRTHLVLFAPLLIVCAVLMAYANSYPGVFLLDDPFTILQNPLIKSVWPLTDAMTGPVGAPSSGRPLVALSFTIDYQWSGDAPTGYRVTNVLIHIANALLAFFFLLRTFERIAALAQRAAPLALVVAMLWAVHPINTSAVTYVSQRAESLMALFFLGALVCAEKSLRVSRPLSWQIASVMCAWACVLCKEVAVVIPVLVFLYERALHHGTFREAWQARRWFYAALATPWLFAIGIQFALPRGNTVRFFYQVINPWTYLCTQANGIAMYIGQMFLPRDLVLDYGWPIAIAVDQYWAAFLGVSAAFAATVWAVVYTPRFALPTAAMFMILAPSSSFIPIITEILAEHRMYLPSLWWIVLVVVLAFLLGSRLPRPAAPAAGALLSLLAITACIWLTRQQNTLYYSEEIMWTHNARVTPNNRRVWYNLGIYYKKSDQPEKAITAFGEAIRCSFDYPEPHARLAELFNEGGDHPRAIHHATLGVQYEAHLPDNHLRLAQVLFDAGKLPEALRTIAALLQQLPDYQEAMRQYVFFLLASGNLVDARTQLSIWTKMPESHPDVLAVALRIARSRDRHDLVPSIRATFALPPTQPTTPPP